MEEDLVAIWEASTPTATVLGRHLLRQPCTACWRGATGRCVSEIVTTLASAGYVTWRPPSRAVSDVVLRTEVRTGRVDRIRRGTYAVHAPVDRAHLRSVERALGELAGDIPTGGRRRAPRPG